MHAIPSSAPRHVMWVYSVWRISCCGRFCRRAIGMKWNWYTRVNTVPPERLIWRLLLLPIPVYLCAILLSPASSSSSAAAASFSGVVCCGVLWSLGPQLYYGRQCVGCPRYRYVDTLVNLCGGEILFRWAPSIYRCYCCCRPPATSPTPCPPPLLDSLYPIEYRRRRELNWNVLETHTTSAEEEAKADGGSWCVRCVELCWVVELYSNKVWVDCFSNTDQSRRFISARSLYTCA